jgi:hypothetical protein
MFGPPVPVVLKMEFLDISSLSDKRMSLILQCKGYKKDGWFYEEGLLNKG